MNIHQFEDENLSHYSYAIWSGNEMAIIDPSRNPQPYLSFAQSSSCEISAVIETHPHADFVSGHLELHQKTNAPIYCSALTEALYPHQALSDMDIIKIGNYNLQVLFTPGHSPDSISILAFDEAGNEKAVFSGDTLFIGDCGRPDLRENEGLESGKAEKLASKMYHSLREKFIPLKDSTILYPAHGAGSLCGKGMSDKNSSSMGNEKLSNWSLQQMSEEEFVDKILTDQPYIPKYFSHAVSMNKVGAKALSDSVQAVKIQYNTQGLNPDILIIDSRDESSFKNRHIKGAVNLQNGKKFESWLGSIVLPREKFYLLSSNEEIAATLVERVAKIGYEEQLLSLIISDEGNEKSDQLHSKDFEDNPDNFTVIDVRNENERKEKLPFKDSVHIPLHQLRERMNEIPKNKAIIVHCAAGYRSAVAASIIKQRLDEPLPVYDLGSGISDFL